MTNRKAALMEALKAIENQRLEGYEKYLGMEFPNQGDIAAVGYSRAIRDAEDAIKALL